MAHEDRVTTYSEALLICYSFCDWPLIKASAYYSLFGWPLVSVKGGGAEEMDGWRNSGR